MTLTEVLKRFFPISPEVVASNFFSVIGRSHSDAVWAPFCVDRLPRSDGIMFRVFLVIRTLGVAIRFSLCARTFCLGGFPATLLSVNQLLFFERWDFPSFAAPVCFVALLTGKKMCCFFLRHLHDHRGFTSDFFLGCYKRSSLSLASFAVIPSLFRVFFRQELRLSLLPPTSFMPGDPSHFPVTNAANPLL